MDNADMFCNTIWDALASQALANWRREVQGLRAGCLLLQLSSDVYSTKDSPGSTNLPHLHPRDWNRRTLSCTLQTTRRKQKTSTGYCHKGFVSSCSLSQDCVTPS